MHGGKVDHKMRKEKEILSHPLTRPQEPTHDHLLQVQMYRDHHAPAQLSG